MKELIRKLVEAVGPSGYEGAVRDLVRSEISDSVGELRVDAMGNLIARKGSVRTTACIMLSAHMDEIVMATHIDETASSVLPPSAASIAPALRACAICQWHLRLSSAARCTVPPTKSIPLSSFIDVAPPAASLPRQSGRHRC